MRCSWCGKLMHLHEPSARHSHGICKECREKEIARAKRDCRRELALVRQGRKPAFFAC